MDNLLLYLLKASTGTALLYLSYLLFFSRDTFYKRNRLLLILALLLPTILPAIKIPVISGGMTFAEPINAFENTVFSGIAFQTTTAVTTNSFNYDRLFLWIYFAVSGLVLLRGAISIISTFRIIKKGVIKTSLFPKVVISDAQLPPFSFFPYAVIPAEDYNNGNCNDILDHEFAHIRQGHTFDLLLCELFIAIQWFNPIVWLIKRSVILNHEYLADHVSLSNNSVKDYQYRLLNFQSGVKHISLAHNFNSLIKNRIIMINKKPTRKYAMMKNLVILPIVALVAYAFATPEYRYTQPADSVRINSLSSVLADGTVKGIILDQNGVPLPGANIQVSGTIIGTSADVKGQFTLVNVSDKSSLVFSFVGYKSIRLDADFNKDMVVRMERITLGVESVVITPGAKKATLSSEIVSSSAPGNAKTGGKTEATNVSKNGDVFIISEEMPSFGGGSVSLMKWVSDHTNYPDLAVSNGISGDVIISFIVKNTGKVGSVKVVKSLDPILDAEAKRVVESIPDWNPGKQNGKPVDIDFAIPITFSLSTREQGFSKTSASAIYKYIYSNIVYPQMAKESSDTGKIYVVVKINKGGVIKECKAFTNTKDINVPILKEVVITGFIPAGQNVTKSQKEAVDEHPYLKDECLSIAKKLAEIDIPEWKEKDMEFALSFKFILK